MRSITLVLVALSLALVPSAAAQLPAGGPTPTYTVEVLNAPGALEGLDTPNATATGTFQVALSINNVVCANAVVVPVTVAAAVAGAPTNFAVTVEPSVLNITIGQGPHFGTAAGGTGDVILRASIAGNLTANASAQIAITASAPAPAGPPTGCQGAGQVGAASSAPVTVFANMTAPPPPPEPTPVEEDTPGFEVAALVLAAAGAAFLGRRRRS